MNGYDWRMAWTSTGHFDVATEKNEMGSRSYTWVFCLAYHQIEQAKIWGSFC